MVEAPQSRDVAEVASAVAGETRHRRDRLRGAIHTCGREPGRLQDLADESQEPPPRPSQVPRRSEGREDRPVKREVNPHRPIRNRDDDEGTRV